MKLAIFALALVCASGCSAEDIAPDAGSTGGSAVDFGSDDDARFDAADTAPTCPRLFGVPLESTGLDETECSPVCACSGIESQTFDAAGLERWESLELLDPPEELTASPYETPDAFQRDANAVCAVKFEAGETEYRLQTLDSADLATRAGAIVTHRGSCGVCSSLADLATYIRNPDLTEPVRECGLLGVREGEEANLECLVELGFTRPCAQIWYHNTRNTRSACLEECVTTLRDPYHTDAGTLNVCLQCDEVSSGPVFKAVAGRTRRNSGLASAICRPCETVANITHAY